MTLKWLTTTGKKFLKSKLNSLLMKKEVTYNVYESPPPQKKNVIDAIYDFQEIISVDFNKRLRRI